MAGIVKGLVSGPTRWLLVFVPVTLVLEHVRPEAHTLLFLLSVASIVPLAGVLSHATEAVAARTGDAVGGLLGATMGNLTELVIALTALRAGMTDLVQASITGTIVTNSLFMLGGSFLLGGLRHHEQEFNPANARMQAGMLLLATIALLIPSALARVDRADTVDIVRPLSVALSGVLLATYGLSLLFSLKTHRRSFASAGGAAPEGHAVPLPAALGALAGEDLDLDELARRARAVFPGRYPSLEEARQDVLALIAAAERVG
jgi:Ca2+:H+ antiporter